MSKASLTVLKQAAPTRATADEQAGARLSAQYRKAMEGMKEIVTFGAMMLAVRDELAKRLTATEGRGQFDAGTGMKAWLKEYSPDVNERTARRFMDLADTVRQLVRLSPGVDMVSLLTSSASQLQGGLAAKRAAIEKLIEGKSQRQLMLMIDEGASAGPARRGGDNEFQLWLRQHHPDLAGTKLPKCPEAVQQEWAAFIQGRQLSPAELAAVEQEQARAKWTEIADYIRRNGTGKQRTWARLKQSEISALADLFDSLTVLLKEAASQT